MKLRLLLAPLVLLAAFVTQAAETPPVTLSCSSSSEFNKWTNLNSDFRGWKFSSNKSAAESYSSSTTGNYWLISQPVTLQAGVKYDITYNVAAESSTKDYVLRFTVGQGVTAEAQANDLMNSTTFSTGTSFKDFSYTFVPETSGEYNFGIWNDSKHSSSIFLKYIKVEASLPFPGAATDVTVTPDANGALGATVAWTWPSVTNKGAELTSVTGAKIYRTNSTWGSATESNLVATVDFPDAQPGGQATWHDTTLPAAGNYYYFVKPYNEHGDSPVSPAASGKTAWIGSDTPAAFTPTATLSDDGMSVSLSWTVTGKNGGTIDPAQISYKIERVGSFSGTTVLETAWQGELPYVDQLTAYDKYTYKVYFITGGTTSTANNAAAITGGPALQTPYNEDFSVSSHGDLWTFVSNITRNWTVSSYKLDFWASKGNDVNAWAITPPLALKAGKAYQLTFKANKQSSATEERNLKVAVANEKTLAAMDAAEPVLTGLFQVDVTTYQAIVTVPADGAYYLGFNINYTSANSNDAYIDDIVLEEVVVAPQAATSLAIAPDANGALSAVVSWTNPTLDNTGNALTTIDKVELYRGEELVKAFESAAPGAVLSVNETYDEAGTYAYSVICYLGENASEAVTATSPWVGVDVPAAPENVILTRNEDGSATLVWSPAKGKQGGYVGDVSYSVTSLVDNQELASALADTTLQIAAPEALAIYAYSVAATNAMGTGEAATSNSVMLGSGITLPYQPTLDADALALWTLPANDSGKAWKYDAGKGGLYSGYSSDLWAFTPPLTAQKGKIKLTVAGTAYSARYTEDLEIGLYTTSEIGAEAVKLDTVTFKNNYPSDNTFEFEYSIPKAGTYFIGYHLITKDVWGCTIVKSDVEQTLAILPSGPVAIEDLTLTPAADGALAASLAWTYPTLNENGEQLEAIDSAIVYRNGEQIAILAAAQPGAQGEYVDAVEAAGMYGYSLVTYSEGCPSQPAAVEAMWIGLDAIAPVASAELAVSDNELAITFDAVACGIHGGYIPAEEVQYDIVDNLTGETVATVAASPVTLPMPEIYNLYSYTVIASIGDEQAEGVKTNSIVCGKCVALDYENTFTSEAEMAVMGLRPNADGNNWKFVEQDGDHYRFFSSVDGAELVTPPFMAQEGTVTASALARCYGALFPETFTVNLYADGQDEAIATATIESGSAGFVSYSPVEFAIPATGIYRVGYTVEQKQIQAYIDGIKLEQTVIIYDEVAKPVANASATAADNGALQVTVAFETPALSIDDAELHHLVSVNVYRGDLLVDSIAEPALGVALEVVDSNISEPGFYQYSIVAITDKHASDTVTVATAWVGLDTAVAPQATVEVFDDGSGCIYIEQAEAGIHGGYVGEIRYRVVSSVDGEIENATANTQIDLSEPESLDVYSFTVWAIGENKAESESCTTASVAMGKHILLPHTFDFAREEIFTIWEMGDWAYDAEVKSVITSQASEMVTPPFVAQRGEVKFDFFADPIAADAVEIEFALLDADMQPVGDAVNVEINSAINSQNWAILAVPADGTYRLAVNAKGAAGISSATLSQLSVDGVSSVGSDSTLAYDPATGVIMAYGEVRVFTASGVMVRRIDADGSVSLSDLASGVYVITCGNNSIKIIK